MSLNKQNRLTHANKNNASLGVARFIDGEVNVIEIFAVGCGY